MLYLHFCLLYCVLTESKEPGEIPCVWKLGQQCDSDSNYAAMHKIDKSKTAFFVIIVWKYYFAY